MLAHLRSGDFLTRARIRAAMGILLAGYALALAGVVLTSADGFRDFRGIPLGSDFFAFWSGGRLAAEQGAAAVYDAQANFDHQSRIFGGENVFYLPFLHPPQFLLIAIALSGLPYLLSWTLFSGATMAAYAGLANALARLRAAPAALLAAPAAFITVTHGQAGFLIAALFAGALLALEKRPLLAGALFGLVAIKPQLAILVPVALVAAGRWRAIAGAAASVLAQVAVATFAFGPGIWKAFLEKAEFARTVVLEQGAAKWETNFTLFAALRASGASSAIAYGFHALLALAAAASLAALWRSGADPRLKAAGLLAASLIATPYAIEYDMVLLVPAIIALWSLGVDEGFMPFEKTALAFAWIAPIAASQLAAATDVPVGFLSVAALFAAIEARRRASASPHSAAAEPLSMMEKPGSLSAPAGE